VLENPALAGVAKERKEAALKAFTHSGLVQVSEPQSEGVSGFGHPGGGRRG
jgi:hypothetical protein